MTAVARREPYRVPLNCSANPGIDIVDTLQPEARDMAPAYLNRRFGDVLSFQGCRLAQTENVVAM